MPPEEVGEIPHTLDVLRGSWLLGYDGQMWSASRGDWEYVEFHPADLTPGDRLGVLIALDPPPEPEEEEEGEDYGRIFLFLNGEFLVEGPGGIPLHADLWACVDLIGNTDGVSLLPHAELPRAAEQLLLPPEPEEGSASHTMGDLGSPSATFGETASEADAAHSGVKSGVSLGPSASATSLPGKQRRRIKRSNTDTLSNTESSLGLRAPRNLLSKDSPRSGTPTSSASRVPGSVGDGRSYGYRRRGPRTGAQDDIPSPLTSDLTDSSREETPRPALSPAAPSVAGLRESLLSANLVEHLEKAEACCIENGAKKFEEVLRDEEVLDELAAHLGLKKLEIKRLKAVATALPPA